MFKLLLSLVLCFMLNGCVCNYTVIKAGTSLSAITITQDTDDKDKPDIKIPLI